MKFALSLLTATLVAGAVLAQDSVLAQAYRTVNVRSGPGTQYDIIGQLTSGDEVQVTGRSDEDSNWLRVAFDGREGWVAYFTVTVLSPTTGLEIVAPRDGQANVPPPPTSPAPSASTDIYVTAYRTVNVRTGPGLDYVSLGDLDAGSTADVTGRSADDRWLRIAYGDTSGWVAFFVVSLTGAIEDIDVAQPEDNDETEEPPDTVEVVTRYNVNLHADPLLESPVIGVVPYETSLQADGRSDIDGTWLRVAFAEEVGWLIRALVTTHGDLSLLPIGAS
ncbi:MAG: SH3 domain-containing protein [Anaerolineae bacterium]|nr:SH3 domain-containing protein [Anaerolineae bacterium]